MNGAIVSTPAAASCSRAASKSNWHSRWCMPASRNASPCSSHHRPTVPSCSRSASGSCAKSPGNFFGRKIDVGKDHDAALRLLQHLRAPARFAAGVEPLAAVEAHLLERGDQVRGMPRGWSGTCDDRDWPSRGPGDSAVRTARAPRGCGFASTRARRAKNRSQAQSRAELVGRGGEQVAGAC